MEFKLERKAEGGNGLVEKKYEFSNDRGHCNNLDAYNLLGSYYLQMGSFKGIEEVITSYFKGVTSKDALESKSKEELLKLQAKLTEKLKSMK